MKLWLCFLASAFTLVAADPELVISSFADLWKAKNSKNIVLQDLEVPAGQTLWFHGLQPGTTITFKGRTTFGYKEWRGPLMRADGTGLTFVGSPNHIIDCGGERWWDTLGSFGKVKPKFFQVRLTDSAITNLNIKNTPMHAFSIKGCSHLTISGVTIDDSEGDINNLGHNTDGFDVKASSFVTIQNCIVKNQDDCLAADSGNDITFIRNYCSGGHGISIIGGIKDGPIRRVSMRNNIVANSAVGIRVKTVLNATGLVEDITFQNIELINIQRWGVIIHGNYFNGGPSGEPSGGVPIRNLKIQNVKGNVLPQGANYIVAVKNAADWSVSRLNIHGGQCFERCYGFPQGTTAFC